MMGFGMGFGGLGILLMVLFWVGLIALSTWVVKSIFQGTGNTRNENGGSQTKAKEILDKRYARGEITREQYELMKQDIG